MDVPLSEGSKAEFRVLGAAELSGPESNQLLSVLARPKLVALLSYLAASVPHGFVAGIASSGFSGGIGTWSGHGARCANRCTTSASRSERISC